MKSKTARPRLGSILRVCIFAGLVCAAYLTFARAIAAWHFRQETAEHLRKAIQWEPGRADFYVALARHLQVSLEGADVDEVIRLYETATRLNSRRPAYWAELGGSYEWAGREGEARRAYERARELFPNSPDVNWKLGNFYLRAGNTTEALAAFRVALLDDVEMQRLAFDLAWRAGIEPSRILREMVPQEPSVLLAYLNYLAETHRLDEAGPAWARLVALGQPSQPKLVFHYLEALIQHQRVEELEKVWATVTGRRQESRRLDGNHITNGSFEEEILNGGFDWRILAVEGVAVSVESLIFFDGARSLRIRFDGRHNMDYAHVLQYVRVEPNETYRFAGYLRAQGVTTDSGPRFQICDPGDGWRVLASTEGVVGTISWSPLQVQLRTGSATRLLVVRLARSPSRMFDNRISGTVWIDRLSLRTID